MNQNSMWFVMSVVLLKLKDFSRSEAVTYTAKVLPSRKCCKIATLSVTIAYV